MEDIDLTPEQEQKMLDFWNLTPNTPPALKDIVSHLFGDGLDGRSKEARAVKKGLSKHNLKATVTSEYVPLAIQLTEAHKEFITNHAANMNALEMARELFGIPTLTNLNAETRAVNEFIKTLNGHLVLNNGADVEDVPSGDYEPPKTLDKVLKKVNLYASLTWEKDKLSPPQKKGLEVLINNLHNLRFIRQMNNFTQQEDRKTCEDVFVRYTYDKPDLSQEEVDQYVLLANEIVTGFKTQRRGERLQAMMEELSNNTPEDAKMSMGLAEMIGKISTEYNQCVKRQQDLLDDLKEKRSSRLSKNIHENASILNLVQEWKNEETRKKWLRLVEREQKQIDEEVEKMTSMDAIKGKIFGLSKEQIKYG